MVLLRPLRLLQGLGEPLSILLHKHTLCTKTDRGSSSLCSSLRGLNSTIQLRIDSYQPAQACPWKFHNPVYAKYIYHLSVQKVFKDHAGLVKEFHVNKIGSITSQNFSSVPKIKTKKWTVILEGFEVTYLKK